MSELIHIEDGKFKLELHISSEDYVKALNSCYHRLASRYNIPGFRQGKAPRKVIEAAYGTDAFWDTEVDALIQHACSDAIQEHELVPEIQPNITVTAVSEQDGIDFTAEIVTHPTVNLGQYKGIEVPRTDYTVTEEDVDNEIDGKLHAAARQISIDDRPLQEGDTALIDFAGYLDGKQFEGGTAENYELKIGSHSFIPGFEEQMVGMAKDEERDLQVTFPENYQAENLAGKPVTFKVKLHNISFEEVPSLDDDFVQDTSEYNNVSEFIAGVRSDLEARAANNAKLKFENDAMQLAIDNANVSIHPDIVDAEIDMQIRRFEQQLKMYNLELDKYLEYAGITLEQLREDYRKGALNSLKTQYVISAIIESEKLEPTEENYMQAVRRYNDQASAWDDEKVKDELEKNRSKYVSGAYFESVLNLIVSSAIEVEPKHEHDCDCGCEHCDEESCDDCNCECEHHDGCGCDECEHSEPKENE